MISTFRFSRSLGAGATLHVACSVTEFTELYSGNGEDTLFLNRRNIVEIIKIEYVSAADIDQSISLSVVEVEKEKGILKSLKSQDSVVGSRVFAKGKDNVKVTYTAGFDESDTPKLVKSALLYRITVDVLTQIADRTGGGNQGTQGHSPNYGDDGKYTNIRKKLAIKAAQAMSKYRTGTVGS